MGANEVSLKLNKNNSPNVFKNYFAFMLKEHKSSVFGVLIILLGLATLPWLMMIITSDSVSNDYGVFSINYTHFTVGVADQSLLGLSRLLMIILPFEVFKYLYDKNKMDRYWSLPISRTKLFMFNTLFVWVIVAIPTVLTYYLQIILGHFFNLTGKSLIMPTLGTIATRSVVLLTICLFSLALSVISIIMTTSAFNGYICAVALNYIPVALISLVKSYTNYYPGYTPSLDSKSDSYLDLFSINGLLMRIFEDKNGVNHVLAISIYIVFAILILLLSAFLYKRRHVERIGSAYMFKYFYTGIVFISVFIVLVSLFKSIVFNNNNYSIDLIDKIKDNAINIASIFTGGLVVFFIINMFMKHGKTKIFRTVISYTLIAALAFGTSVYGLMEIERKSALAVPELREVDEIKLVAYDGVFRESKSVKDEENAEIFNYVGVTPHFKRHFTKNPDEIAEIRELHIKAAKQQTGFEVENQYEIPEDEYSEALVKIVYYDKSGATIMQREYYFYYDDVEVLSKTFGQNIDLVPIREAFRKGLE